MLDTNKMQQIAQFLSNTDADIVGVAVVCSDSNTEEFELTIMGRLAAEDLTCIILECMNQGDVVSSSYVPVIPPNHRN